MESFDEDWWRETLRCTNNRWLSWFSLIIVRYKTQSDSVSNNTKLVQIKTWSPSTCLHGQEINNNFKFKSSKCFGCTSKLKNCLLPAQCCAVKMPPRLPISNSTMITYRVQIVILTSMGWKVQVCCTTDHTQQPSWVWSGVSWCICEHNQMWHCTIVHREVPHFTGRVLEHEAKCQTPLHGGCMQGLHVWPCSLEDMVPKYRRLPMAERSPLRQNVGTGLHVSHLSRCQPSLLSDTVRQPWGCPDCLIQLQLSSPLIVGFKLTYVLA